MRGVYGGVNKLVPNLGKEGRYVLHYRNLQLCLSLGIKLTGVHRILKFKQSYWLKKYIDFSTDKRKNTVNSFENDLFKLINNSVYSKTMENLRKITKIRLVNNAKNYKIWVSRPSFVSKKIISRNCVAIHEIKLVLTLDKPTYVE